MQLQIVGIFEQFSCFVWLLVPAQLFPASHTHTHTRTHTLATRTQTIYQHNTQHTSLNITTKHGCARKVTDIYVHIYIYTHYVRLPRYQFKRVHVRVKKYYRNTIESQTMFSNLNHALNWFFFFKELT